MIVKLMRATVRPGCREAFLERQRVWNEAMARQAGFVGCWVATDPGDPRSVHIALTMRSREDLDRFMAGEHDEVARQTGMAALYEALEVRVLDVAAALPEPRDP